MLWICGAILTIAGSLGTGLCILGGMEERIVQLKGLSSAFRMLANEISYSHAALPEALAVCGRKLGGELGVALCGTAQELGGTMGKTLERCWQEQIGSYLQQSALGKKEREAVLFFPQRLGFGDRGFQEENVRRFAEELEEITARAQEEKREKQRVVLGLSAAGGLMAAILLC